MISKKEERYIVSMWWDLVEEIDYHGLVYQRKILEQSLKEKAKGMGIPLARVYLIRTFFGRTNIKTFGDLATMDPPTIQTFLAGRWFEQVKENKYKNVEFVMNWEFLDEIWRKA